MPDVMIVGTALWHLLHIHDADAYERQLELLRDMKLAMLPDVPAFFLAPSEVCLNVHEAHVCSAVHQSAPTCC
jgi:hypothetical protein